MIGFAKIEGGAPSSVKALGEHLLTQTVTKQMADVAKYYSRGGQQIETGEQRVIRVLSSMIADGSLSFSEAVDEMMSAYIQNGGDIDLIDQEEESVSKLLSEAAFRAQEMEGDMPMAVLRPDMHPLVANGLGIKPELPLTRNEVNALLSGHRADGKDIDGKVYAKVRRLADDPKTGERKWATPIGSYDFCPTPHKSVSVAWAFAQPAQQAMIFNAHHEAAREAMAYLAREIGLARYGKGGEDGYEPGHVGWMEFTHFTARRTQIVVENGETKIVQDQSVPGDPDLHTHFLIPNAVFCESGRVGSLHTGRIQGFIFEADTVYHALLAQKLRDAGFGVHCAQKTGAAAMSAVPAEICDLFSKRTKAGEALAKQYTTSRGEDWDTLPEDQKQARIKSATQSLDQKVKGGKDDMADVESWKYQAKQFGWEPGSFLAFGPQSPALSKDQRIRSAYDASLPWLADDLEKKSVLSQWEVRVAAGRGLVAHGIDSISDVNDVTKLMREEGVLHKDEGGVFDPDAEKTVLIWGRAPGEKYVTVTTALHEAEEKEFIQLAREAAADKRYALPEGVLDEAIRETNLDFTGKHGEAQLNAMRTVGCSGGFSLAVGAAGSGKSTMLKPLVRAWRKQGREVYGASLAWRQTDDLTDAWIGERNLNAFSVMIEKLRKGDIELNRNSVVVVDEWGLLGTRQGLSLLRLQKQHGFQIVSLGDEKQCASIEAGAIVELCRRALGPEHIPQILTTKRQLAEREQKIVALFREGKAKEALDMKRQDQKAELVPGGYDQVVARAAKLFVDRLKETGESPSVSAPTNLDAHKISAAIREERRKLGEIGKDLRTVKATNTEGAQYALPLAKGDRLRLFKSTRGKMEDGRAKSIGRNGSVVEVLAVSDEGITLKSTKNGRVGKVAWEELSSAKNGRSLLAYGDVLTINSAQGMNAHEHIFCLPAGSGAVNGLQAYTAGTRHRTSSWLLTSDTAEFSEIRGRRALNDTREVTVDDKWANVARNLSYQPEKDLAVAMLEKVEKIRRGTVKKFAPALQPSEDRRARGMSPSILHEKIAAKVRESAINPHISRLLASAKKIHGRITGRDTQSPDLGMGR